MDIDMERERRRNECVSKMALVVMGLVIGMEEKKMNEVLVEWC